MLLSDYLTVDRVLPHMRSRTKQAALGELAAVVSPAQPGATNRVVKVLADREKLASTGIGDEVAIPHGKLKTITTLVLILGRSAAGVEFGSIDGKPARLLFALVAPENSTVIHLKALARISRICKEPRFRDRLLQAADSQEMLDIVRAEDSRFAGA